MTYNTKLAAALRKHKVPLKEIKGWQRRGHGGMASVHGILLHHTAGPAKGVIPSLGVLTHGRAGLSGPLCNLGYGRDGKAYVVAGGRAYHAGAPDPLNSEGARALGTTQGNSYMLGIEMESTGRGDWTDAQRKNLVPLLVALCRIYDIPPHRIIAHREWAPRRKPDPVGINMDKLRAAVARELRAPKVDYGRVATKAEILKCRLTGKLVPDGKLGTRTVRVLERALGVPRRRRSGVLHGHDLACLSRALHVTPECFSFRPALVEALQTRVGVRDTGHIDARTIRALQRYLNRHKEF